MKLKQNDLDHILDMVEQGKLTASQANVEKVRRHRVLLVTSSLPADVRKALNNAVKRGVLGHIKKNGMKPEAYYHPTFEYLVAGERNAHESEALKALRSVCA